jgi:peptidoglycan/xylan/chitin deacetylase (PgdA/CDA1 family)
MYHQVTPRPVPVFRKYAVTPKDFAAQMNWLALAGYIPINFDVLLRYRSGHSTMPPRPIIITFDDGFQDCSDYAVPILQAHGFTAVFYLVAGLIGQTSQWLLRERGLELPLMDWTAVRRLQAAGFQCGAHSMSHSRLTHLSSGACRNELLESRRLLEDYLGYEVRHLAYPHGSFNERVRAIVVETGYLSACSVRIGLSAPDDDPLALPRVPVCGQDSLLDFICRLHTARSLGEVLHSKARNVWQRLRNTAIHPTS